MLRNQIKEVIDRCGPRPAGSAAEKLLQDYFVERLRLSTSDVHIEAFESALDAKFQKLKLYGALYFVCLTLYWWFPAVAMVVALLNAIVLVGDLMRNDGIVDFLFPRRTSWNVSGTLEPTGEVKRTLIFSGHSDSSYECKWWYKWKDLGAYATIACGVLIVLLPFYLALFLWWQQGSNNHALQLVHYVYLVFVIGSPCFIVYLDYYNPIVVDGACDNLSGCIIALNVFEQLKDPGAHGKTVLPNTRVRFVSFGAEECGLRGSMTYVKKHIAALQNERVQLINIDSVRLASEVTFLTGEWMSGVFYSKEILAGLKQSFKSLNLPYKLGNLPMGATDAVPFRQYGLPAVSIIGLNMKKLDPTYHTRLDTVENIEEEALQNVVAGLVHYAKM